MDEIQVTQPAGSPSVSIGLAAVRLLESKQYRREEDWTGKDKLLRRKLQNRINQRKCRNRKARGHQLNQQVDDTSPLETQLIPKPALRLSDYTLNTYSNGNPELAEPSTSSATLLTVPTIQDAKGGCSTPHRTIMLARDFNNWLAQYQKRSITPFSSDHLLTLMFFNVIRAHCTNCLMLGVSPETLADDDILSPFNINSTLRHNLPSTLPPSLRATHVQKAISHHPEIDLLPWPQVRDNMILAQGTFDDYAFCGDMIGRPCDRSVEEAFWWRENPDNVEEESPINQPGLIVWSDSWKPDSWEVSESFLRKWGRFFVGCRELLESTNYWREKRGEERLVWEV